MKNFLKQILYWLRKLIPKKRLTLVSGAVLGVLILCFLVFWFSVANADVGIIEGVFRGLMKFAAESLLAMGELCMRFSVFFLSFFIALARWNNYIDVPIVMLGWTMVRDVANMFFVIILLLIAIGTILGLEQYQWNKVLVKMILAAVFINFSNLICGIFIDIAHVFTITFVNAIAATAGGNLINMFHLNDLFTLVSDQGSNSENTLQDMDLRLFAAATAAFLFAVLSLVTIAVYCIVMVFRMIMLWILVILSPIAYIASVLPQSQSYAKEWWDEFGRYVLVAPMMVFFLWLAFATMGEGQIMSDMKLEFTSTEGQYTAEELSKNGGTGTPAASLAKITEWANLANLLIPICLLWAGLERVQKLGVRGGSMISKGMDMFKNVATMATGYAAGRWLARGAAGLGKKVGKGILYHAPLVGGQAWVERAKLVSGRVKDAWYAGAGGKAPLDEKDYLGRAFRATLGWNFGVAARGTARRRKRIKAAEGAAEAAESLLGKQQSAAQWGNRSRTRRGQLEAYEERSKNRDAEGIQSAKVATLSQPRMKDGKAYVNPETGEVSSLAGEAARFALRKETLDNEQRGMIGEERKRIIERAMPDIEQAGRESEVARQGRKSKELLEAENAERQEQDAFRRVEAELNVRVNARLKEDGEVVNAQRVLSEAPVKIKNAEQRVTDFGRAKEVLEGLSPEEQQEHARANGELAGIFGQYDGRSVDELLEKLYTEHGWSRDADEKNRSFVQAYTVASMAEQLPKAEDERQQEKNKAEDAQILLDAKRDQIRIELEGASVSGGPTFQQQAQRYGEAQSRTSEARVAWEKVAEAAAQPPSTDDTPEVVAQRKRDAKVKEETDKIEESLFEGELTTPDGETVMANGKPVQRRDSNIAIAYLKAKQRATAVGAGAEAAETEAQKAMLGLESFQSLFFSEVGSKMGVEASKAFIDGIKEKEMGKLFKRGAVELEKSLKEGGKSLENLQLKNVGARMAQAQMISEYNKDISGANKREAADHAESIFTMERYGFKTPSSAFKDWVKKQTERLQGVEREQSVKNAMGTLGQFFRLRRQGKEISTDQKAQMMAHLKHLTTNGWMDDLLDAIGKKSRSKANLVGEAREEAEALEDVFFNTLQWKKSDNRSGADRTAQVQKLVGMGGDVGHMQSDEAVAWRMENTGEDYGEANKRLAEGTFKKKDEIIEGDDDSRQKIAVELGIITQRQIDLMKQGDDRASAAVAAGVQQLLAYTQKFALPAKSAEEAAEAFLRSLEKFQDAFEMLADFKNLAMATGHTDDGGHTYYDASIGMVRGNLGHRGKAFTLGEWRKLGLDQRLSRLKTHTLGRMNEDYQTIDYTASEESDDAIRETFAGLSNQREFAKVDGRNKDHIAGMGAGEQIRQTADGRTKIGDEDSVYFRGTFRHIVDREERHRAVESQLRGNYAAFLRNNPAALFGSLAERSGLSFDEGMKGNVHMNICGVNINSVEDLVGWINQDRQHHFDAGRIRRSLAKAGEGKNRGGGE